MEKLLNWTKLTCSEDLEKLQDCVSAVPCARICEYDSKTLFEFDYGKELFSEEIGMRRECLRKFLTKHGTN